MHVHAARTQKQVTLGEAWAVFLRVEDEAGVEVTESSFRVPLDSDDGIALAVDDASLCFLHAEGLFQVACTPAGRLHALSAAIRVRISLELGAGPECSVVRGEELAVEVAVGAATQLQLVHNEQAVSELAYTSGELLGLTVVTVPSTRTATWTAPSAVQ